MPDLAVSLYGKLVGHLSKDDDGYLSFSYDPVYVKTQDALPLSQSLPLRTEPYDERACAPFFSGLLPDSDVVRKRLEDILHVSWDNDFDLLANLGRDCAGAVVLSGREGSSVKSEGWLQPLTELDLADMITALPVRPLFVEEDEVMLSLAGVHDKAAVYVDQDGQIFLPHRGYPSTHILKTDIKSLPDSIRTEHFCLTVARKFGLPAPHTHIGTAGEHVYMLVSRYDRVVSLDPQGVRTGVRRLHQEDFCQARGVLPKQKYEGRGGPSLKDMYDTLRASASVPAREMARLTDFVIYNFLIGNPDSHAKNYSLIYRPSSVQLAPIYDVNNAAAFSNHFKRQLPRMAQSIGGTFLSTEVGPEHWRAFAKDIGLSWPALRKRLIGMATALPAILAEVRKRVRGTAADSERVDMVVTDTLARCARVLRDFGVNPAPTAVIEEEPAPAMAP